MDNKVRQIIKINLLQISTDISTDKFFSQCLLASNILIFIMILLRVFNENHFIVTLFLILSTMVIASNISSFNSIDKKLKEIKYNLEIEQLTKIIDLEPQNADAYFVRGEAKEEIKEYQSAFHDFEEAERLKNKLSNELAVVLADKIKICKENLQKIK